MLTPFVRVRTDLVALSEVRCVRRVGDVALAVWFAGQEGPELLRDEDANNFNTDLYAAITITTWPLKLPIGPMPTGFGLPSNRISLTMKAKPPTPAPVPVACGCCEPDDDADFFQDSDGLIERHIFVAAILGELREVATHEQVRIARDLARNNQLGGTFAAPPPLLRALKLELDAPAHPDAELSFADEAMRAMAEMSA